MADLRRKTVTALFADVVGSTSLGDTRDPEAVRAVMGRYFDHVSGVIAPRKPPLPFAPAEPSFADTQFYVIEAPPALIVGEGVSDDSGPDQLTTLPSE